MVLLQDTETRSIRGSVGENKDLPSIICRVRLDDIFEPIQLFLVNGDFVRCVLGSTENSGSHTDQESLFGNLTHELGAVLSVDTAEHFKVGLVGGELVNSLKIFQRTMSSVS